MSWPREPRGGFKQNWWLVDGHGWFKDIKKPFVKDDRRTNTLVSRTVPSGCRRSYLHKSLALLCHRSNWLFEGNIQAELDHYDTSSAFAPNSPPSPPLTCVIAKRDPLQSPAVPCSPLNQNGSWNIWVAAIAIWCHVTWVTWVMPCHLGGSILNCSCAPRAPPLPRALNVCMPLPYMSCSMSSFLADRMRLSPAIKIESSGGKSCQNLLQYSFSIETKKKTWN